MVVAALLGGAACDGDPSTGAGDGGDSGDAADAGDNDATVEDATADAPSETDTPDAAQGETGFATFSLSAATETTYTWSEEAGNHVFCRFFENEHGYVSVRFAAAEGGDDGESAPHVDIDICAFAEADTFLAQDPSPESSCRSPGFDIWWHDGPGVAYANGIDAAECVLEAVDSDGALRATFACDTLLDQIGDGDPIGIEGTFGCVLEVP